MERYDKFTREDFYVELWLPTTADEPLECLVKIWKGGIKVKSGTVPLGRFPTPLPNAEEMEALLAAANALIAEVDVP